MLQVKTTSAKSFCTIILILFLALHLQSQKANNQFNTTLSYPVSDSIKLIKTLYGYKICDTLGNLLDINNINLNSKLIYDYGNWNSTGLPVIYTIWQIKYSNNNDKELNTKSLQLSNAYPFCNGYARVQRANKYNFIDIQGKLISQQWFSYAEDFSNKRALVSLGKWEKGSITGKFGYIDSSGAVAIPMIFDCAESFNNNTARVWIKGKTVLLGRNGMPIASDSKNILEAGITLLNKNMPRFQTPDEEDALLYPFNKKQDSTLIPIQQNQLWGFALQDGKIAIPVQFDYVEKFAEGVAQVRKGNIWNIINMQGEKISAEWYEYIPKSKHGLILVKKQGKIGVIDRLGNDIIPLNFPVFMLLKNAICYENNQNSVKTYHITSDNQLLALDSLITISPRLQNQFEIEHANGMLAIIDSSCNFIQNWHYRVLFEGDEVEIVENKNRFKYRNKEGLYTREWLSDIEMFPEGILAIKKNSKWGYINKRGKTIIEFQYDDCRDFRMGCAIVAQGNTSFLIDKYGKKVSETFDIIGEYNEDLAPVSLKGKWGYINETGKIIIKPQYNLAGKFSEGLAAVKKGRRFAYIHKSGQKLTRFDYTAAANFKDGIALVRKGKQNGYIDKWGNFFVK